MIRSTALAGIALGVACAACVSRVPPVNRPASAGLPDAPESVPWFARNAYHAELARVRLEARIAQAEIDALPTPQQR
jgi:hypothetical protein